MEQDLRNYIHQPKNAWGPLQQAHNMEGLQIRPIAQFGCQILDD